MPSSHQAAHELDGEHLGTAQDQIHKRKTNLHVHRTIDNLVDNEGSVLQMPGKFLLISRIQQFVVDVGIFLGRFLNRKFFFHCLPPCRTHLFAQFGIRDHFNYGWQ